APISWGSERYRRGPGSSTMRRRGPSMADRRRSCDHGALTRPELRPPAEPPVLPGREILFIVLAAAAYVVLAFLTEPSLFRATDFQKHWLHNQVFLGARLAAGEWPLWNPYVGLGRPFLA